MGCDIHIMAERKVMHDYRDDDRYKYVNAGNPGRSRNYALFAVLAGVRNDGSIRPIHGPRGLPGFKDWTGKWDEEDSGYPDAEWDVYDDQPCREYMLMAADMGVDGHSHSWLMRDEIGEYIEETGIIHWQDEIQIEPPLDQIARAQDWDTKFTIRTSLASGGPKWDDPKIVCEKATKTGRPYYWMQDLIDLHDWMIKYEADRIVFFFDN